VAGFSCVTSCSAQELAAPADLDVLGEVIATAFHDLAPSRWLIADPTARSAIFPGYFCLLVAQAMAAGWHTIPGRDAVALWLPAGPGTTGHWPGYGSGQEIAAATRCQHIVGVGVGLFPTAATTGLYRCT
jgi:hypothetical protein